MLIFLSPAKSLDYKTPPQVTTHTLPAFLKQSEILIKQLRKLSPAAIATLMDISDPLALLNFNRFADWSRSPRKTPSRQRSPSMVMSTTGWRRRRSRLPTSTSRSSTCASSRGSTVSCARST